MVWSPSSGQRGVIASTGTRPDDVREGRSDLGTRGPGCTLSWTPRPFDGCWLQGGGGMPLLWQGGDYKADCWIAHHEKRPKKEEEEKEV